MCILTQQVRNPASQLLRVCPREGGQGLAGVPAPVAPGRGPRPRPQHSGRPEWQAPMLHGNHTARSPETLSDPGNVDDGSLEMFLQICKMHSFCKE